MSILEADMLDMSAVLMHAYDMGDMIKSSAEVADYLYWKTAVESSAEVKELQALFMKKKELFEECERFGHYQLSRGHGASESSAGETGTNRGRPPVQRCRKPSG
jgi:hypothetical protein